jgi:hypothetical protein
MCESVGLQGSRSAGKQTNMCESVGLQGSRSPSQRLVPSRPHAQRVSDLRTRITGTLPFSKQTASQPERPAVELCPRVRVVWIRRHYFSTCKCIQSAVCLYGRAEVYSVYCENTAACFKKLLLTDYRKSIRHTLPTLDFSFIFEPP